MTSTPTSISFADLKAAGEPHLAAIADKLARLHVVADGTGQANVMAAVQALHDVLAAAQDEFIGLFPNDATKPQPQEGGGEKNGNPP